MFELILIIVGLLSILLGYFYFENKKLWMVIGVILMAIGAYFMFFAAAPIDDGDSLVPGTGPDLSNLVIPPDENEPVLLRGIVMDYHDCPLNKICIQLLDQSGSAIEVIAEANVNLIGVETIDAFGHFEDSTFMADSIFPTRMKEALA